jgi:D-apiose dehydrogenase
MSQLRVACVGTGYFSQFQYAAWTRMPDVTVVGIANRTLAAADTFAATFAIPATFTSVAEMLDTVKPDLLDIITPPSTHLAAIEAAATRGVNVICQKPFCQSLGEAQAALLISDRCGTKIFIHENFRFQPWHTKTRELVASGLLGEIYQATFRLRPGDGQGPRAYLDRQPTFQTMPRFLIHETAIHLIDTFRYIFGEVTSVYASLRQLNPAIKGEDAGIVLFDFKSGVRAIFDGNRLADHKASNRRLTMGEFCIEGAKGTLSLDGDGHLWFRPHGTNTLEPLHYHWNNTDFGGDCVYLTQRHIVDHLLHGSPAMNMGQDYLRNIVIEVAVYRSNDEGRRVAV